jgi:hypothetical protein
MSKRFGLGAGVTVLLAMLVFSVSAEAGWRHFGWRLGGLRGRRSNVITSSSNVPNTNAAQGEQHQANYEPAYQPHQAPEIPQMNDQGGYERGGDQDNSIRSDSDKNQSGENTEGRSGQDKASIGTDNKSP